jgi:hypothetical protein
LVTCCRSTPEAVTQARLPVRWTSRRAAAGRSANACGRTKNRAGDPLSSDPPAKQASR